MKRVIALLSLTLFSLASQAQCAMCKASVESNGGEDLATGLNSGIIYLMFIPYLLIGGVAYAIYKHRKKAASQEGA